MARYANLKEYLQNEHIKLIEKVIMEHQNNDADIIGNTHIESLYCIDDAYSNLKMKLVVSVDGNDIVSEKQYYRVILFGSLYVKLQDIQVIDVKKCDKSDICADNLLNHFILPDIRVEDFERIGNELFTHYIKVTDTDVDEPSFLNIISNMNTPIFFTDLPDDCFGRINLVESEVNYREYDVYGNRSQEASVYAQPGIILLNKKRYLDEENGEYLITVAHELVHWQFHKKFFMLLVLLGTDSDTMSCKMEPVVFSDSMSDIEKAMCIAEWQANSLAMRFAIPSCTVDAVNNEIANDTSTNYENYGDRMQAGVKMFAEEYSVSCFVAKARMRQLGYDFVDGTILEYEENRKKIHPAPFYFQPGTLKENETFVIYRDNYERLLRENDEFAELINSGRYIYLGYVVCMLSAEYVSAVFNVDDVKFKLSDYAREHAHECLIKFKYKNIANTNYSYSYQVTSYLNKMPDYNEVVPESFELCKENTGLDKFIIAKIKEYNDKLNRLKSDKLSTFANTLIYHMKKTENDEKPIDDKELEKRTNLSLTAIKKIYTGVTTDVDIRNVMTFCIALELDIVESCDMFEKAGHNLMKDTLQNRAYRFIIENQYYDLNECNGILRYLKQDELPYHKRNRAKNRNKKN